MQVFLELVIVSAFKFRFVHEVDINTGAEKEVKFLLHCGGPCFSFVASSARLPGGTDCVASTAFEATFHYSSAVSMIISELKHK